MESESRRGSCLEFDYSYNRFYKHTSLARLYKTTFNLLLHQFFMRSDYSGWDVKTGFYDVTNPGSELSDCPSASGSATVHISSPPPAS
jgi:hypothetical protein